MVYKAKEIFLWYKAGEEVPESEEHLKDWIALGLVEEVKEKKNEVSNPLDSLDDYDINNDGKVDGKDLNLLSNKIKADSKKKK